MVKVEIGDKGDVLVCIPITHPLKLPDNETGKCAECGSAIQFRPGLSASLRKICMWCAVPMIEEENTTIVVTPRTVDELIEYFRKKMQ